MTEARFRLTRKTAIGLLLVQALGLSFLSQTILAQSASGSRPALPATISAPALTGLELPPDLIPANTKPAIPEKTGPSYITGSKGVVNNQAVDLISLYQEASFSDPVMNSARFQFEANKELYWQGLSLLLPQMAAAPGLTRYYQHAINNSTLQSFPGNGRVFGQKNYSVTLTQPVFNLGAFEAYKQGDLNTKIAELQFYQAQQDLVIRVSQAYFDALNAQDNVELYRSKMTLIQQQLDAANAKFQAGLATIVDVNTAQASFDLAKSQEINAQADLVVKLGVLEQFVGHPIPSVKPLSTDAKIEGVASDPRARSKYQLPAIDTTSINPSLPPGQTMEDWIHQAENGNFGVLASKLNVDLAESTYRGSVAANYPSASFGASSGYNTNNGSTYSTTPSQTNIYNNTISFNISIPIFSGGYNNSVIRQNAALYDKSKADYDNQRRTTAQFVRQSFTGFYGGLASVKAYEAAERSGTSAVDSSKLGFEVGTLINLDVLVALDSLFNTRALLTQARYSTILNALKLKAAGGVLTDQDLLAINSLLR